MKIKFSIPLILILTAISLQAETYTFSGNSSFSVMREGEEITTIEGSVEILSESKEIYADKVAIEGTDNPEFSGQGQVRVVDLDKNIELKSQKFDYSSLNELLRSQGDVRMEDRENNLFIRCQVLTVYEGKDQIIMEIGVRLFKDDIICRSQYAVYHRDENILELTGFPVVYKGEDLYRADRIQVNLDTDEITMTGRIEGSLLSQDQEESENETPLEDEASLEKEIGPEGDKIDD